MKSNSFTTTIIYPENGFLLTQSDNVELKDRIFASEIALGKNDDASNWKEISIEEAEAIRAEQNK